MKKINFVLFIFVFCLNSVAQKVQLIDKDFKTPIENVNFTQNEKGQSTNKNGIVDVSIFNDSDSITISHISYQILRILKKDIKLKIKLKTKMKILPSVNFVEEIKIPISKKYPVFSIKTKDSYLTHNSIANLLSNTSSIVVQESQSGGGSPNYRGMEANRLLLVLDGIPLNNAIYRSGHLQSSATINPFFISTINLISGPASVAYGNGAMGGALIFNTKNKKENSILIHQQFESSNNAVILNFIANYFTKNQTNTTAFSLQSTENLKMGKNRLHGYKIWGVEGTKDNEQLLTAYKKADFMHKTSYQINLKNSIIFNTQYSTCSDIYRFDKMNDIKNGRPKYEKWYYGPQIRFFKSVKFKNMSEKFAFDKITTTLAYQDAKESRHKQKLGEIILSNRHENVKIYDLMIDLNKLLNNVAILYGGGIRKQNIYSKANFSYNNITSYNTTRYPSGGSIVNDYFTYMQSNIYINKKVDLMLGLRWNNRYLLADFNENYSNFNTIKNNNSSFITSALFSIKPTKSTNINTSYYGGFRNPNIDDVGKVFSKDDINVIIPNESLEPEYANNYELSLHFFKKKFKINLQFFKNQITNAINREYATINGVDSMLYDGEIMRIQMNKNIERATINGISLTANYYFNKNLSIYGNGNYLKGVTDQKKNLSHIPPLNTKIKVNYYVKKHLFEFYANYNAWKKDEEYDLEGIDNLEEATIDGNPSWWTINFTYLKHTDSELTYSFSIKNISDNHYKTFGSGISASGRNFIISLKSKF